MQLLDSQSISKRRAWRTRVIVIGVVALGVGGWLGYSPALQQYHRWKQRRALQQARDFIAKKDAANAQMALEVALAAVPNSPEAWRIAADMLEQAGAPQSVRLRRRLVQFAPDSATDRAALVLASLRFGDYNGARDALAEMTPAQAVHPEALRAALAYALATNNNAVADALFDRLKKDYPTNENLQITHAMLHLKHPKPERVAEARRQLEVLAKNPAYAAKIERELLLNSIVRRDYAEAKQAATRLLASKDATFSDRLHNANLELLVDKRPFDDVFRPLGAAAATDLEAATQLVRWLLAQRKAIEADRWSASLTPEMQKQPDMLAARADVVAELRDWDRLALLLETGAWGRISPETLKLATSARVMAGRNNSTLQRQMWDEAMSTAGNSLSALRILHRLAAIWQWDEESERTLWTITRAFPDQTWAHQTLFNVYRERKNTEGMRTLMAALRNLDGTVPRFRYDWAVLSLLTEHSPAWTAPKSTLQQMSEAEPANAFYATGYAFALTQAGRVADALKLVEKLAPEERELPGRAPYLAFIYASNHRKAEFEKYAAVSAQLNLLPEEKKLVDLGREALDRPLPKPAEKSAPSERKKS